MSFAHARMTNSSLIPTESPEIDQLKRRERGAERSARAEQVVSEMAVEVLARQAEWLAAYTGRPLGEAYEEVS